MSEMMICEYSNYCVHPTMKCKHREPHKYKVSECGVDIGTGCPACVPYEPDKYDSCSECKYNGSCSDSVRQKCKLLKPKSVPEYTLALIPKKENIEHIKYDDEAKDRILHQGINFAYDSIKPIDTEKLAEFMSLNLEDYESPSKSKLAELISEYMEEQHESK